MRKLLFFALYLVSTITFSQSPQFLNYQAVARDASGTIVTSAIGIKFEILQGSSSGTLVYEETNNITPSSVGVFTAAIGAGSPVVGTFSAINWANGPYFISVSIDPAGGIAYSTVGTSKLLSVPYALYAEGTKPSTLSISGNSLSINNGNSITLPAGTSYTAGTGISISGNTITNTAPTPTLISAGISSVTGTYPTFTIDVPPPSLNYNTGTQELTLTQGTVVTTETITTSSASVSITGPGVSGAYPSYTITPPASTSITPGNSNITVTGSAPNFTISAAPQLTVVGNQLSISNGNTVTLPTGTTYTNGAGIALTSGTIITNTAPNQTVMIGNGTNVNVTGTYPNFTVNSTPTLSIVSNTLSISGGNSITLPPPPTPPVAGPGISIISGTISNTAPNQTVNVSGPGVIGAYPSYTVTAAPATTVASGNNIVVNGTSPSYTVNSPTYSLSFSSSSTGVLTNGMNSNAVSLPQPSLTLSGPNSNVLTAGSNSVTIATYTAGSGLALSGTAPNFTLSTTSTGTNTGWKTLGNTGTIDGTNFIGTTDNIPFNIRVNNQKAGRIDHLLGNAFYGYQAGNANTTGTFNVAFGNQTLLNNTNGSYNTALGINALYFNSTGSNNTASGYQALFSNTTGPNNTANGGQALYSNTTGTNNTASGFYALHDNTTGSYNTASGYYSLNKNTTGGFNTATGEQALYWVNGNHNTGHGYATLQNNTSGSFNTVSGAYAGYNNNGSGNVFLGYQAGYNETGSNKLYIANSSTNPPLIYGDFSAGRVGIGTNSPLNQLHVLSNSSTYIKVESSSATTPHGIMFKNPNREWNIINFAAGSDRISFYDATAGQERFVIDGPTGNVGIGTTAPTSQLEVIGVLSSGQAMLITNNVASGISGSSAAFNNTGLRSVGNSGVIINNLVTKVGGSNSTKVGLEVNSTGAWGVSTVNQPNVGVKVVASGADNNYALQLVDGSQGPGKVLTSDAAGNASWASGAFATAYLKDVKPNGTVGGTFTSGTWLTRTLNTIEGDASIVTLAADMFTLQPGVYDIYAEAPAHNVNNNKIKLFNVTDNSDAIIGGYSQCIGVGLPVRATLMGRITIASAKVFSLQHRCNSTQISDGFGSANTFGVVEVFSQIKITKVQ